MGNNTDPEERLRQIADVDYPQRYCIVGGGPCGLLAARAFKLANIPYDQFERHNDIGGVWDMENPGTPMYETAHFIASRFTSGFYGFPMPDSFPDYPSHEQVLDYIRQFAITYGLRDSVRCGVGVERATPIGSSAEGGWRVALSSGETRTYRGIVCANGVTWHPQMPSYPGLEEFTGEIRHSVSYRTPAEFANKKVLIIGAGNSGVDIACDAAYSASAATISLRRGYYFVPKHIFGVPTDVILSGSEPLPEGVAIPEDPAKMLDVLVGDLTRYGLPAPDHGVLQSHPIMNNQILHYLAHGDLRAKGDVRSFTRSGVVFDDGTEEDFDLVLCATGYEYRVPFIDRELFTWEAGHPQLYLNIFHRNLRGLSAVGFVEFASAGYQRFDEIAQMIAMDAFIEQTGDRRDEWRRMKAEDRPNMRGTMSYIDSPRHTNYVDVQTYRDILYDTYSRFDWPQPSDGLYAMRLSA
ncbi:flavin-containing monooxygenase [Pyruvatibacter mobilis]|uniref:flavin-containing monooxygenase n=1 Tax=Pyruvatibacter mobilis TaxID=1712261 RepID=UPI003BA9ADBA